MEAPSYIATNLEELFDSASPEIQALINNGEVDQATKALSDTYQIPESAQTALSNVISFIVIKALQPDNVIQALEDIVGASNEDALKIANDLEKGILKKVNISILPSGDEIKTLDYQGPKTPEELRKEILSTTKRESGLEKSQAKPLDKYTNQKKPAILTPGSRSQLLEHLQVLGTIPNDDEISERLQHIQEQISAIKKQEEDNSLDSNIALKSFMFGEKGKQVASPTLSPATYSVAPTEYNIDPYREISGAEF